MGLEIPIVIPDLWQQEAVHALRDGKDVVVHAPTGAGKTFIFELIYPSLKGQAIYTVPTRALANDKLAEWRARGWDVGISTGDLAQNLDARVVVATLETQRGQFLRRKGPRLLVIDEYQMLADANRGVTYELALALSPPFTQLLLLSGSVANPADIVEWLKRLGRNAVLVSTTQRPVPLEEVLVSDLPIRVPSSVRGHWPRLVAAALMADLGPVLIFAPRRAAAEDLAASLASALPCDNPLSLSTEQAQLAGDPLNKLLRQRIAFHHSGLSYAARAGLIEPLAKAGQLRVVVATTGLAAGVNFSMRSVLITDTRYLSGPFERHLQPEELLQMFGRAGRRGLDETGYVLATIHSPRLGDARPGRIARANQVDWPSIISVMQTAAGTETRPFDAAEAMTEALFSRQHVPLGVEASLADGPRPCGLWVDAERARFARPSVVEMRNSKGEFEPMGDLRTVTLSDLLIQESGRWTPALRIPKTLENLGEGQLCRIPMEKGWRYGREVPLGTQGADGMIVLSKWLRRRLRDVTTLLPPRKLAKDDFDVTVAPLLEKFAPPPLRATMAHHGNQVMLQFDFARVPVEGYVDRHGRALQNPEQRKTYPAVCETCPRLPVCISSDPAMTPALAWRKLGLVQPDGTPTRRGILFSFFHQGEGLAISAALEDETYDIPELIFDLANLRAGHRFSEDDSPYGGRLGITCQRAFGHSDYPGYLEMGVPVNYGNGASEVIAAVLNEPGERRRHLTELLRPGDIERAMLEWRSLLRQICFAPPMDWPRWESLRRNASEFVGKVSAPVRLDFPPLTGSQLRRISHRLVL